MIRLRQVVMVARELDPVVDAVCRTLDVEVCFRDPGVAEFGLVNALMAVGDQFIEVVSPQQEGTTAGRLLDKRGGDGGYMVIVQCDDLDRRRARLRELGVRVVWQHDLPDIRGTHLHPRDVGGAIVSIDEATPPDTWRWAGTEWRGHVRTGVVDAVVGVTVGADNPAAMAARWSEALDAPLDGDTSVRLDDAVIGFVPAGERGEGVDAFDLRATDRTRAGEAVAIGGVELRLR
jgi:hypothetical protein